jgi:Heparinase II/III-like protein
MATGLAARGFLMSASAAPRVSLDDRAAIVAGPLAPLAASLAADLDRLLPDEDVLVPAEKAKMTRHGGRCPRDGTFLEFDPRSPQRHRCPACGSEYEGEEHYRWWVMGYQLWLAERAVHASALWRLGGHQRYRSLAESILRKLGDRYLSYPNEDNVLGPTRVFFSTYLESIWALQLGVAVSLLERGGATAVGNLVRERILAPATELVRSFNEGHSNRQVWNSAALGTAGALLGRQEMVDRALFGPGGLEMFLRTGLLGDGSWYEGENYHLFAHRGLWYLVMLADQVGATLPRELVTRFEQGFVAPFRTALPDFTFPARRDSQYRASLRQWRIAESAELGLARTPDSAELATGLAAVYADVPAGDSARWRSTAEAERNVPGVRLTRADLGWKSLLYALPEVPTARVAPPASALMDGQGFAVMRREGGRVYAALDYGHTGGSHGHPDRLNLWLVPGDQRVFEDVGTGSYVERTLHWYRSTLAHNAPLIDGRSQRPVAGVLRAWDEHDDWAWVDAEASVDGVLVRRSLVMGPGYIVDRLEWTAARDVMLDLPMHVEGELVGAAWRESALEGGAGLEDGFGFVKEAETAKSGTGPALVKAAGIDGAVHVDATHAWWRAVAPGPPGQSPRRFMMVRAQGEQGGITSAWSWNGPIELQQMPEDEIILTLAGKRSRHRFGGATWSVQGDGDEVVLAGQRTNRPGSEGTGSARAKPTLSIPITHRDDSSLESLANIAEGLRFELGEGHYRRTEATWKEAGAPTATVLIGASRFTLLIEVQVKAENANFVPTVPENPLDNEHPDTNSDGVQVHLSSAGLGRGPLAASWLLVPENGSSTVRITGRDDAVGVPLRASWHSTPEGWQLFAQIDRKALGPADAPIGLDVIVNEMPRSRERRRGQLVLSGGNDWAYLRGDRQDPEQLIPMVVRNG